jgi:hypothetical protein
LVEKERREDIEARKKRLVHADDVRTQIREKEQVRISERNAFFEEGVKLDEEARQRRAKLEEVKKKKLEMLRWVLLYNLNKSIFVFFSLLSSFKNLKVKQYWIYPVSGYYFIILTSSDIVYFLLVQFSFLLPRKQLFVSVYCFLSALL